MPLSRDLLPGGSAAQDDDEPDTESQHVVPIPAGRPGEARPALIVLAGRDAGRHIQLDRDEVVLGRGRGAQVTLSDEGASRRHARIRREGGARFTIEDLGSVNGTWVDGERIDGPRRLTVGQRIQIGTTVLRLSLQDAIESRVAEKLYESSVRDPLTGAFNRRHLEDRLAAELSFARRRGAELSLLLLDLDYFKRVNDEHGHPAGDAVLKALAELLSSLVRTEDLVARYGGEEFVVLLHDTGLEGARALAERFLHRVAAMEVPWESTTLRVTVSIGIACHGARWSCPDEAALVAAADEALYRSKDEGRGRLSVYEPG